MMTTDQTLIKAVSSLERNIEELEDCLTRLKPAIKAILDVDSEHWKRVNNTWLVNFLAEDAENHAKSIQLALRTFKFTAVS